ncbi:hypothetical protein RCL1_008952 [Eukaryota sp. TZLM3-RCL]
MSVEAFSVSVSIIRFPDILNKPETVLKQDSFDPLSAHIATTNKLIPFELTPVPPEILKDHSIPLNSLHPSKVYLGETIICRVTFRCVAPVTFFSPSVFTKSTSGLQDSCLFDRTRHTEKTLTPPSSRSFLVKFTVRPSLSPSFSLIVSPLYNGRSSEFAFPFTVTDPFIRRLKFHSPSPSLFFFDLSFQSVIPDSISIDKSTLNAYPGFQSTPLPSPSPCKYLSPSDVRHFIYCIKPERSALTRLDSLPSVIQVGNIEVQWRTEDLRIGQFLIESGELGINREVIQSNLQNIQTKISKCVQKVEIWSDFELQFTTINHLSRDLYVTIKKGSEKVDDSDPHVEIEGLIGFGLSIPCSRPVIWTVNCRALKRGFTRTPELIMVCEGVSFVLPRFDVLIM